MVSLSVPFCLHITAEFDLRRILCAADLKRIAVLQPLIRDLDLISVTDLLFEHSITITDAAAICRIA